MAGRRASGFTLLEILVVVVIIGILVGIAVPNYYRTLENARADDSVATLRILGTTSRMYFLDRHAYPSDGAAIANPPITTVCQPPGTDPSANLIACGYLARQEWPTKPYQFFVCAGCGGDCSNPSAPSFTVACAKRRTGVGNNGTSISPYNGWGYNVDNTGVVTPVGNAPAPVQ